MDKMVMQGLEDAAIAKDVMEEDATNDNLHDTLTLKEIEKLIEAEENAKRSMDELIRAQDEPRGTTNKLYVYHKGKSAELQKRGDNPRSTHSPQRRSGTHPDSRPTCTFCNY